MAGGKQRVERDPGALQQHSPYIGIEQFSVAVADRSNANVDALNVAMKVSSVEIIPGAN